jgi:arylsulfatase A-like enzyme
MSPISTIPASLAFAFMFTVSCWSSNASEKPNVIIVMTDDQGYGDLSCHGNPILKTPHLDALHAESVRFTDFHVSPFCTPTRAALMTGNTPGTTGAFRTSSGRTMMHTDEKTVANLFSENGYATGMVGKWHLGDNAPHRPQDRGFQDVVWHRCGGIGQASDYWGNDYFDDTYERNGVFETFEGYCTDVWFREGMRFVEENREKPFFLYLALNAPHGPYFVPPEWAAPYKGNKDVANPNFYGMVANFDHNMGLLRNHLDELGIADNTILIFMTDNGTAGGAKFKGLTSEAIVGYNAGMRGKKSSVYEGGHRVPFFIHWPKGGLEGGKDIDTLAAHIDVLPTLADLCGISVPEGYDPDGLSLRPLLEGEADEWPRDHLIEQYIGGAYAKAFPPKPYEYTVVMTERWRLVNSDGEFLFDIEADPAQREDLSEKHPEVVAKLRALYDPFWEKIEPRLTAVRIDLGNPAENPTVLCSQDWYMSEGNPPWNFGSIKKLPKVTGPWMVEVKQSGTYRLTLRQMPVEADLPVKAVRAKVQIAGQEMESEVQAGSKGVVFEMELPAGETELLTWLYDESGKAGGAYFTEVELLETVLN